MFSALFSFLGGSVFRMIWGEVSAFLTAKQSHAQEVERMRLQGELDAKAHERNLAAIKLQADLGVKTIQVQADADIAKIDASAWAQAVADVGKTTGIKLLDIWNGAIRPYLATLASVFLLLECARNGWGPTEHVLIVCDAILGIYVADRSLSKRGK